MCGEEFFARTLESWYCSPKCSKVAWKRKHDEEKRQLELDKIVSNMPKSKEYISITEVEKPREFAPRGQSDDDPLKLFIFDPCKVLTDGVIFILPYYFFAFILRMLSPVSSILCDECTILSSTASATVGSPMASYQLATGSCEDMTIAFLS